MTSEIRGSVGSSNSDALLLSFPNILSTGFYDAGVNSSVTSLLIDGKPPRICAWIMGTLCACRASAFASS